MSSEAIPMTESTSLAEAPGAAAVSRLGQWWERLDGWLDQASDYLNPILVKETRQALRSRQFVMWFLLLLAACWIVTTGVVAYLGPGVQYAASGGVLFLWYFGLLAFALVVVVPFTAFRSLAAEQEDNTRDVLMVSALTPNQVINGKLGSAGLQMVVYLSALSPCLAFSYLLRGIDLLTILLVPLAAVLASFCLSMLGLLMASVSRQRFSQVFSSVLLLGGLFFSLWMILLFAWWLVEDGYSVLQQTEFWVVAGIILNVLLCAFLLAYYAAIGMNTFASANRSTALRYVMFFTQACFIAWVAFAWRESRFDDEVVVVTSCLALFYWYFMGTLLTGEQMVLSERVRRGLPTSTLGRALGAWFNPGPGTGYFFVLANMFALVVIALAPLSIEAGNDFVWMATFLVLGFSYLAGYLGLGRLAIHAIRRVAPLSMLGCFLIHVLLLLTGAGLTELIRASLTRYARAPYGWYDMANPFRTIDAVVDQDLSPVEVLTLLMLVPGVAFCVFMVNLVLAAREIRQTRAPLPQRVIEDDALLRPVVTQVANPWGDLREAE